MNLPEDFVFSQSSLQDYVDCPRRFQLRYLLRQRWPAPEVDDVLEFEARAEQGVHFHQLVHQHLISIPSEVLKQHIADEDVERWFEAYLQTGLEGVPQQRWPELTLTVPLGDYWLLAKFDLLAVQSAGRIWIIDWKTSHKMPRREWVEQRLQTMVYRYVLAKGGDHYNGGQAVAPEQIEMVYWYANHEGGVHRFPYSVERFRDDESTLLKLVEEIDKRADFQLTEDTQHCRFCVYRSLCDRGAEAGSLADWDVEEANTVDLADFEIDLDQIAEIEF